MAILIDPTGSCSTISIPGHPQLLPMVRKLIGGPLEVVALADGWRMVVNENGLSQGLAANAKATSFARHALAPNDYIKGQAILFAPGELESADGQGDLQATD